MCLKLKSQKLSKLVLQLCYSVQTQANITTSLNTPSHISIKTQPFWPTCHTAQQRAFGILVDLENEAAQQRHIRLPGDVSSTYSPAAGNVLISDSTKQNASSPFFRLPPELRLRIYELVLGGQTLHIIMKSQYREGRHRRVPSHHLCSERESEENAQTAFDSSDAAWNAPATLHRHVRCYNGFQGDVMLEKSLLQSCRQIYNEANIVRYYSNTFSFLILYPHCLKLFYQQTPARYRNAIRRLHLDIDICHGARDSESREWADVFRILAHQSKGIQRLYLSINLTPCFLDYQLFLYQPPSESQIITCMLQLAKMNLKIATVTIGEYHDLEANYLWTMAQKKELSQYLRKALLCHGDIDTSLAEEEA